MSQTGQTILALVTPSAHSVPLGTETLVHWEAYRLHLGVSLLLIFFLKYRPFSISALRLSLNSPTNKCARNSCPTKFFAFSFLLLSTELPFTPLPLRLCLLRLCLCAFMLPRIAPRNVTFDDAPTYQISFRSCSFTQSCIMAICPSVLFARAASTPEAFS